MMQTAADLDGRRLKDFNNSTNWHKALHAAAGALGSLEKDRLCL